MGLTMDAVSLIRTRLRASVAAKEDFVAAQAADLQRLATMMRQSLEAGGKMLVFGNGGSAADAQHFAAEFVNRFLLNRRPLAALALTTDSSVLTAIANDFAFEDVFAGQIEALGKKADLALAISTSGRGRAPGAALSGAGQSPQGIASRAAWLQAKAGLGRPARRPDARFLSDSAGARRGLERFLGRFPGGSCWSRDRLPPRELETGRRCGLCRRS